MLDVRRAMRRTSRRPRVRWVAAGVAAGVIVAAGGRMVVAPRRRCLAGAADDTFTGSRDAGRRTAARPGCLRSVARSGAGAAGQGTAARRARPRSMRVPHGDAFVARGAGPARRDSASAAGRRRGAARASGRRLRPGSPGNEMSEVPVHQLRRARSLPQLRLRLLADPSRRRRSTCRSGRTRRRPDGGPPAVGAATPSGAAALTPPADAQNLSLRQSLDLRPVRSGARCGVSICRSSTTPVTTCRSSAAIRRHDRRWPCGVPRLRRSRRLPRRARGSSSLFRTSRRWISPTRAGAWFVKNPPLKRSRARVGVVDTTATRVRRGADCSAPSIDAVDHRRHRRGSAVLHAAGVRPAVRARFACCQSCRWPGSCCC